MGFLTQTDSAEAPFPHSTPETAEFLGEDLLQVRAWAGWAGRQARAGCQYRGWQARTAVKGLVVSFPAGQGRPRREEKSDSCSGRDNRAMRERPSQDAVPTCPSPIPPR